MTGPSADTDAAVAATNRVFVAVLAIIVPTVGILWILLTAEQANAGLLAIGGVLVLGGLWAAIRAVFASVDRLVHRRIEDARDSEEG